MAGQQRRQQQEEEEKEETCDQDSSVVSDDAFNHIHNNNIDYIESVSTKMTAHLQENIPAIYMHYVAAKKKANLYINNGDANEEEEEDSALYKHDDDCKTRSHSIYNISSGKKEYKAYLTDFLVDIDDVNEQKNIQRQSNATSILQSGVYKKFNHYESSINIECMLWTYLLSAESHISINTESRTNAILNHETRSHHTSVPLLNGKKTQTNMDYKGNTCFNNKIHIFQNLRNKGNSKLVFENAEIRMKIFAYQYEIYKQYISHIGISDRLSNFMMDNQTSFPLYCSFYNTDHLSTQLNEILFTSLDCCHFDKKVFVNHDCILPIYCDLFRVAIKTAWWRNRRSTKKKTHFNH